MARKPGASSFFIVAIILGVLAAFLIWRHERQLSAKSEKNWKIVVTARRDIAGRVQITRDMIEPTPMPDQLRVENVYERIEDVVGKWTTRDIRGKEQIRGADAVPKAQLPGFGEKIGAGQRLITISAGELTAVGGVIKPGDKVDILATFFDTVKKRETTQMILQNIKVFFVNQGEADASTSTGAKSSLTLEVTPEVAELITAAERKATLKLALRGASDPGEITRPVPDVSQIWALIDTMQKIEATPTSAPTIAQPVYTPQKTSVTVIRGTSETLIQN